MIGCLWRGGEGKGEGKEGKGREGKGRKGREGKGREGGSLIHTKRTWHSQQKVSDNTPMMAP